MRKPHARAAYSAPAHQTDEFARHVLRYVGPMLANQQRDKDAEVCIHTLHVKLGALSTICFCCYGRRLANDWLSLAPACV